MRRRLLRPLVASGAILAGAFYSGFLSPVVLSQEASPPRTVVLPLGDTPGRWVPFSAVATRVLDPGKVVFGMLYRAADGSRRSDTGPSPGVVDTVGIMSVSDRSHQVWQAGRGWQDVPMFLPGGRFIQPPVEPPLSAVPVDDQVAGLRLVRMPTDPHGNTMYLAPELNYFPVTITMPCNGGQGTGCGLFLTDIRIGEQPPELFALAVGEPVPAQRGPARPGGR